MYIENRIKLKIKQCTVKRGYRIEVIGEKQILFISLKRSATKLSHSTQETKKTRCFQEDWIVMEKCLAQHKTT